MTGTRMGGRAVGLDEPYAWQAEALDCWRRWNRRGIVEAVTGTGKTFVGVAAAGEALEDLRRVAVLVPTRELQQQWHRRLVQHLPGVRIGLRGDGYDDTLQTHPLVVSIINSARQDALRPPADSLVIADECHRYAAKTNMTALSDAFEHRLGLTATLERPDQLEDRLKEYFGRVVFTMGYEQAIADEVTAHFTVGLVGLPMSAGEREEYEAFSRALSDAFTRLVQEFGFPKQPFHLFMRLVAEAAQTDDHPACGSARAFQSAMHKRRQLLAIAPTKIGYVPQLAPAIRAADRTLVFTDSIATSERVCEELQAVGLRVASLHSGHHHAERADHLRRFANGYLDVVVAPRVLDEGVDVPEADLAIIVAGSNSRRQMVQRMGRVLRRKADGRLARLGVLYLERSTEDPLLGAHEVFLGEVLGVAEDYKRFKGSEVEQANAFLVDATPIAQTFPPRRPGEPARVAPAVADDTLPVSEVLALPEPETDRRGRQVRRSQQQPAPSPPRPAVSADDKSKVRVAFRQAHRFISKSEERDFERELDGLLAKFGIEVLLDAVTASPVVSVIAAKAASRVDLERRVEKARAKKNKKLGQRGTSTSARSSVDRKPADERAGAPNLRKSPRAKPPRGAGAYERPRYQSPSGPVRRCRFCHAPESACRC